MSHILRVYACMLACVGMASWGVALSIYAQWSGNVLSLLLSLYSVLSLMITWDSDENRMWRLSVLLRWALLQGVHSGSLVEVGLRYSGHVVIQAVIITVALFVALSAASVLLSGGLLPHLSGPVASCVRTIVELIVAVVLIVPGRGPHCNHGPFMYGLFTFTIPTILHDTTYAIDSLRVSSLDSTSHTFSLFADMMNVFRSLLGITLYLNCPEVTATLPPDLETVKDD